MRKKKLFELNLDLFKQNDRLQLEIEALKKQLSEKENEIKTLKTEMESPVVKDEATPALKTLQEKVQSDITVNEETSFGASIIGKIVVEATTKCNELTSLPDNENVKELVNLILGRTEVAKSEILKIISTHSELQEKKEQILAVQTAASDYFDSVMAQKD